MYFEIKLKKKEVLFLTVDEAPASYIPAIAIFSES